MNDKHILLFLTICLIIYLYSVFHRAKLEFAKFLLSSVCTFLLLFFTLEDILTPLLAQTVAKCVGFIGNLLGMFETYPTYGIIFIKGKLETISLYIDYECAGFIESVIFFSLIMFFPVFKIKNKLPIVILGELGIFISNIIRLLSICIIVYYFGNESFYFAHTIFGRLLFYGLSMCLYYFIFTMSQIKKQKIGSFEYVKNIDK